MLNAFLFFLSHLCVHTVGSGAAGNVLANRLTENEKISVLLVEAVGDDVKKPEVNLPHAATELKPTDVEESYKMVPQKRAMKEHPVRLRSKIAFV